VTLLVKQKGHSTWKFLLPLSPKVLHWGTHPSWNNYGKKPDNTKPNVVNYYPRWQQSPGVEFLRPFVSPFICMISISKTDAARITKRDIQMFHDESKKPIYFGVKKSQVKVSHKSSAGVGLDALLWVLSSSSSLWLLTHRINQRLIIVDILSLSLSLSS